jgi:succinate dehydrogenase cytochrome b556 subunit
MQEKQKMDQAGAWGWLAQRLTAALILVLLGIHFWVLHFSVIGERITFERVGDRLASPWFIALDLALLATVLYHAFYGIRGIIIDMGLGPGARAGLTWSLVLAGVAGFALGFLVLVAFL